MKPSTLLVLSLSLLHCADAPSGEPPADETVPSEPTRAPTLTTEESAPSVADDEGGCGCPHAAAEAPRTLADDDRIALEADDAPAIGRRDAALSVVLFGDYRCPFTLRAFPLLRELLARRDDVRVVFRQLPLPMHPDAEDVARAALAAAAQGRFGAFQDLFADGRRQPPSTTELTGLLALSEAQLRDALYSPEVDASLARDRALATKLAVRASPTLFVGGRRLEGLPSPERLTATIEAALED
ncbi:MAG: thioredoxin domain-containing protein [Polyangiaceae bacterium]